MPRCMLSAAKHLNFSAVIDETYQYIATSFAFPTRIAPQGVRNTLDMVAQRNPKIDMNPAKYIDESTLDELEKEGFFKRITGK